MAEAQHGLKLANKYRLKVKRGNVLYQLDFLTKLAEAKEPFGNNSSAHYLGQLQQTESIQKSSQRINFVTKKLQKTATIFVTRNRAHSMVEEITDKNHWRRLSSQRTLINITKQ